MDEGFGLDPTTSNSHSIRHPLAVVSHLCFRITALVVYLLCGWFSDNFIGSFLVILILLSLDFWAVKNVTGRLLVGLRWWNYVDEHGSSHWVYEARKDLNLVSPIESRLFWTTLILFPLLWIIFFFVSLFSLKFKWFVVVCIAIALHGANLYGYIKCKLGKKQTLGGAATSFFQQNVLKSMFQQQQSTPRNLSAPTHTI